MKEPPGTAAIASTTLDTPWFKSERLAEHLRGLRRPPSEAEAFAWLADATQAGPGQLPNTGIGLALEKTLSPVFIQGRDYGTRSSMLLNVSARGDVSLSELSWGLAGREAGRRRYTIRPGQVQHPAKL